MMHFFRKRLTFLAVCGIILLSGMYYQAATTPVEEAVRATSDYETAGAMEKAPDVKLPGMDGDMYTVGQFSDKPLLLTFFASWCDICQKELPQLSQLYESNKDKFHVAAVNATSKEYRKEDVYSFVREAKLSMPVLLDKEGEAIEAFHVSMVPVSFLIDTNGTIQNTFYGPISADELNKELRSIPSS
ncbi:TlpA family protein disulfide reductase [Alteribacillus iranensis]|uniref:Peroxiredoxin n=1 Tax=Alteribacillus iranensis TaxID=930128 RepID=A0A1I2CY94_9BACI|nr:TlpA disulfide reductase family protein [Alteribacillus iranensis]SFE73258.1 Peroxiredoxin [Alteribacillus iranensis]